MEDRPGTVVKSSHWCQEVLGLSSLSAIIADVRLEKSSPRPHLVWELPAEGLSFFFILDYSDMSERFCSIAIANVCH
jgi:hypothetical protein